jgi:hypothetical protein
MKCSEYVKSKGVKSLVHLADVSQLKVRTLQIWYTERPWLFDAVLEKASKV